MSGASALIGNEATVVEALGGGALALAVCLLSLPSARVLSLPPFHSANLTAQSLRQGCRCQVAPRTANGTQLILASVRLLA